MACGVGGAKGLDIQLTKLLMDGQLDAFARMLQRNYDVSGSLPKHYREALVLYNHVSQQPLIVFHSNLDETYDDFLKLKKLQTNRLQLLLHLKIIMAIPIGITIFLPEPFKNSLLSALPQTGNPMYLCADKNPPQGTLRR